MNFYICHSWISSWDDEARYIWTDASKNCTKCSWFLDWIPNKLQTFRSLRFFFSSVFIICVVVVLITILINFFIIMYFYLYTDEDPNERIGTSTNFWYSIKNRAYEHLVRLLKYLVLYILNICLFTIYFNSILYCAKFEYICQKCTHMI